MLAALQTPDGPRIAKQTRCLHRNAFDGEEIHGETAPCFAGATSQNKQILLKKAAKIVRQNSQNAPCRDKSPIADGPPIRTIILLNSKSILGSSCRRSNLQRSSELVHYFSRLPDHVGLEVGDQLSTTVHYGMCSPHATFNNNI